MTEYYYSWHEVPEHLHTRTQLAALDLPRIPGGPVHAQVAARGGDGRRGVFDLYTLAESTPSPASAKALAAAIARRDPAAHRCQDCGANTDQPTTPSQPADPGQSIRLCWTCLHIHRLRTHQASLARMRETAAAQAAAWLAEDNAAVLAVTTISPPPTDSGKPRPAIAAVIDAVTPGGAPLLHLTVHLRASRFPHLVPEAAVDRGTAAPALRTALRDRPLIDWHAADLDPLRTILGPFDAVTAHHHLSQAVTVWRSTIDPTTDRLIPAAHPGRADRMALLIHRIADDH
jgi:hypothetical protein